MRHISKTYPKPPQSQLKKNYRATVFLTLWYVEDEMISNQNNCWNLIIAAARELLANFKYPNWRPISGAQGLDLAAVRSRVGRTGPSVVYNIIEFFKTCKQNKTLTNCKLDFDFYFFLVTYTLFRINKMFTNQPNLVDRPVAAGLSSKIISTYSIA